jgi:uridine kinase
VFKAIGGEKNAVYLTHDHYYKDISHKTIEERAKTNFDHPDSLDTDLLVEHIKELKAGKTACLPNYDFATHSRTPVTTLVHPKKIIIVEGILIFTSKGLCDEVDMKVFVVCMIYIFTNNDAFVWQECQCCDCFENMCLIRNVYFYSVDRTPTATHAFFDGSLGTLWSVGELSNPS